MLARLRGLFRRYADRHLDFEAGGFPISDPTSEVRVQGYVDLIRVTGNRVIVSGWTTAPRVSLVWDGGRDTCRPQIARYDVATQLGLDADVGFDLEAPLHGLPLTLSFETETGSHDLPLSALSPESLEAARRRLIWRFALDLGRVSPDVLAWSFNKDPFRKARIKSRLKLDDVRRAELMQDGIFDGNPAPKPQAGTMITIVMPVFNAFEVLQDAVQCIQDSTDVSWRLIVVEDCSTDPRVRPYLRTIAKTSDDRIQLIENDRNLGFVKSVNRGFEAALEYGDHVVLLNSDALVPREWASRLLGPIMADETVASATPMSNNATILSVPVICEETDLEPGEATLIDLRASQINPDLSLVDIPTAVGFCMAINHRFLKAEPHFDTAFRKGYGEEVDWCQKARKQGGRHVCVSNLFVEHRGNQSFGRDQMLRAVEANNAIIQRRYPDYDQEVQDFLRYDPLITSRMALALAWAEARSNGPVPIYLAHSLGGGADDYLERVYKSDIAEVGSAVVLRVGGRARWQLEVHSAQGCVSGATDNLGLISDLLGAIRSRRIVYSCGVGDPYPAELPSILLSLLQDDTRDSCEALFHDYFPVSPSYCLLDSDTRYRGPVLADRTDVAHSFTDIDGQSTPLSDWQAAWGEFLRRTSRVIVFSENSRGILLATYPELADRIVVRPHEPFADIPRIKVSPAPRPVIGVLGNIGAQKGAGIVEDLSFRLERSQDAKLVLLGNIDPSFQLAQSTQLHGSYRHSELEDLVRRYGITCWLIPSIWPETFSFTTQEALVTGMPVYCFDLGAQGDAVRGAANGHVIPMDDATTPVESALTTILSTEGSRPVRPARTEHPN